MARSRRSRSRWNPRPRNQRQPRNQRRQSDVWETVTMAIEVRIPTILRSYTGGDKAVEGKGDTLADLFADLDARHGGLRGRLVGGDGSPHRVGNVYLNHEDARFPGGVETPHPGGAGGTSP